MSDLSFILSPVSESNAASEAKKFIQGSVALLGVPQVGKSSLASILSGGDFPLIYQSTCGDIFKTAVVNFKGTKVHLHFIDIGGRTDYQNLLESLVASADIFMFVFDVTNRKSFAYIEPVFRALSKTKKVSGLLLGNRCDLSSRRKVNVDEAEALARKMTVQYLEVSAKHKISASECLHVMASLLQNRTRDVSFKSSMENRKEAFNMPQAPPRSKKVDEPSKPLKAFPDKTFKLPQNDEDEF